MPSFTELKTYKIFTSGLCFSMLLLTSLAVGCGKPNTTLEAGTVNLLATVKHHQLAISYSKVYVKYNTLVFPGTDTTLYDSYKIADVNGFLRFDNLENGEKQLVLFATGVDPDWDSTHVTKVWGYLPVAISTAPGESKDLNVTVAVSE